MKKNSALYLIFGIIAICYSAFSLYFTNDKNAMFWTGFVFFILSLIFACTVCVMCCNKRGASFATELSAATISCVYSACVLIFNLLCVSTITLGYSMFLCLHIVALAFSVLLVVLMLAASANIIKQNEVSQASSEKQ